MITVSTDSSGCLGGGGGMLVCYVQRRTSSSRVWTRSRLPWWMVRETVVVETDRLGYNSTMDEKEDRVVSSSSSSSSRRLASSIVLVLVLVLVLFVVRTWDTGVATATVCFVPGTGVGLLLSPTAAPRAIEGSCDRLDCRIVTNSYRVFRNGTATTITVLLLLLWLCLVRSLLLLPFRWWTRSKPSSVEARRWLYEEEDAVARLDSPLLLDTIMQTLYVNRREW